MCCSDRLNPPPTRDIPRSPRGRAPCKRGAPGANSQALIESTRFTPWRVIESLDEKIEKRICDADLAGSKFLIRWAPNAVYEIDGALESR